jgi:hypothetical protein
MEGVPVQIKKKVVAIGAGIDVVRLLIRRPTLAPTLTLLTTIISA